MEEIKDFNQTAKDNKIIVDSTKSTLDSNSVIKFNGKNNILVIEDGVKLVNSRINFGGDNAVVYLSRNKYIYYLDINAYSNTCVFIGKDNFFNGRLSLIASERKNIIIGDNGLISFGIFVRTADPHLIYSCETKQRINKSKSVLIGDHVWLGQGALILKGTKIGSGSILGGGAVISNKSVFSNASAVGNPAKIVAKNIFFSKESVHNFNKKQTEEFSVMQSDEWIYSYDNSQKSFSETDNLLSSKENSKDKLNIIKKNIVNNTSKNRFFIAEPKKKKFFSFKK